MGYVIYTTFTTEENKCPCQQQVYHVQIEFQTIIGMYPLHQIEHLLCVAAATAHSQLEIINAQNEST